MQRISGRRGYLILRKEYRRSDGKRMVIVCTRSTFSDLEQSRSLFCVIFFLYIELWFYGFQGYISGNIFLFQRLIQSIIESYSFEVLNFFQAGILIIVLINKELQLKKSCNVQVFSNHKQINLSFVFMFRKIKLDQINYYQ